MGLTTYRKKRDFKKTPEPRGEIHDRRGFRYLIQKHAASRLHYDFRLELDGVLKSWAVPKGPSLDPADKRLAVHVEDHPVEYGDFEGTIPKGEYGGGTVLLWDRGHWSPEGDARAAYAAGKLKFRLEGEKLEGGWTLVRIKGRPGDEDGKNWLLIKEKDDQARPGARQAIVDELPLSVATGRTLEAIAAAKDRVWHSKEHAGEHPGEEKKPRRKAAAVRPAPVTPTRARTRPPSAPSSARRSRPSASAAPRSPAVAGARKAPMPEWIAPELATLVAAAPAGDGWLHEIKLDGYRITGRLERGAARLLSRNAKDWTASLPQLAEDLVRLGARQAFLDGEIVVFEPDGRTSFQALQNAIGGDAEREVTYCVFDLLYLDGKDLTAVPLRERKIALAALLESNESPRIRYVDHVEGRGPEFFERACGLALEGIISKRADAPHRSGRGRDWVKVKCVGHQEFVVVGYTEPSGSRTGLGALLLAVHEKAGEGKLLYSGRVGTGFTQESLEDLLRRLGPLEQKTAPVANPPKGAAARGVHWVKPSLVAEVKFTGWTDDDILRHPSFQGLREDKAASDVVRERPAAAAARTNGGTGPARRSAQGAESAGDEGPGALQQRAHPPAVTPRGKKGDVVIAGVRLTNPDKVLYRDPDITKRELAEFYAEIAPWMLPHVVGRPLMLLRCPEGQQSKGFYQKHAKETDPPALRRINIDEGEGTATCMTIDDVTGLVSLVQMGALETHVWGSVHSALERPDRIVFDLDPDPTVGWEGVVEGARLVRDHLATMGLVTFLKTTGGKGLHVVLPIERRHGWDEVKQFAKDVAEEIARMHPAKYTAVLAKAARKGRVFIDYLRNGRGATAVAAWSTRARPGAPVSTPVRWDELDKDLRSDHFNVRNVRERLARLRRDPWEGISRTKQRLPAAPRPRKRAAP